MPTNNNPATRSLACPRIAERRTSWALFHVKHRPSFVLITTPEVGRGTRQQDGGAIGQTSLSPWPRGMSRLEEPGPVQTSGMYNTDR